MNVTLAASLGIAIAPAGAAAGTYTAYQCSPRLGAGHEDATFSRTSDHYVPASSCDAASTGLQVTHDADATGSGKYGAWSLRAPDGTELVALHASVSGERKDGHAPELLVDLRSASRRLGDATGRFHRLSWSGSDGRGLTARLRCAQRKGCGRGRRAHVNVKRIAFTLKDGQAPALSLSGPLLDPGSRRGAEALTAMGTDVGGGVRRFLVEVNGHPADSHTVQCDIADERALRLRPCPGQAEADFAAATDATPFVQGPNRVRVCALDYAADTSANQACETRTIRVDNECPLSGMPEGARLVAHFANGASRLEVDRGEGAGVTGRVLDEQGQPVAGAQVCVATRVPVDGQVEQVLAMPTTDADGRFAARIPAGPSREVRVAYWRDSERPVERMLALRVRAEPRLRLLPGGALHNHDRVWFRTQLPGPMSGGREARLEVRAGGRWLRLRSGRTNRRGVWRSTYRFHATTRRRAYRFRAVVPGQQGYPYEAGRSRVRRQVVIGR